MVHIGGFTYHLFLNGDDFGMVNMALFYLVVTHMSSENNYQQHPVVGLVGVN